MTILRKSTILYHRRLTLVIFLLILLIGIFFRTYKLVENFDFAHDADLYSWIVKDIVVDGHLRLIGQLTSADGIYIGPLFYYLLIPFFILFKMDPIGGTVFITLLGVATLFSYYFVFSKLFNRQIALIITFFHSILLTEINSDRWVVPSTPTKLWSVWYFYTVIQIVRGNYRVLPILAVLTGLIWHIHIALAPALLAIPVAIILSKKIPNLKQLAIFLLILFLSLLPLIAFEVKHDFAQSISLLNNFSANHAGGSGLPKLNLLMIKLGQSIDALLLSPQSFSLIDHKFFFFGVLLLFSGLVYKQVFKFKEFAVLFSWMMGVLLFYVFSTSLISEYYLSNLDVIFLIIVSCWVFLIFKSSRFGRYLILSLLIIIAVKNIIFYLTEAKYEKGYPEKKAVVNYLVLDSKKHNFPCIAVSYIAAPGENVGFRYFFWLNNLHVNQPKSGSPVYTIVIPEELAADAGIPVKKFGHIGVYGPDSVGSEEEIKASCSGQNSNLTDPMLGFSN